MKIVEEKQKGKEKSEKLGKDFYKTKKKLGTLKRNGRKQKKKRKAYKRK